MANNATQRTEIWRRTAVNDDCINERRGENDERIINDAAMNENNQQRGSGSAAATTAAERRKTELRI